MAVLERGILVGCKRSNQRLDDSSALHIVCQKEDVGVLNVWNQAASRVLADHMLQKRQNRAACCAPVHGFEVHGWPELKAANVWLRLLWPPGQLLKLSINGGAAGLKQPVDAFCRVAALRQALVPPCTNVER